MIFEPKGKHLTASNQKPCSINTKTMPSMAKRQEVPEAVPGIPTKYSTVTHQNMSRTRALALKTSSFPSSSTSRLSSRTSSDASKVLPWLYLSGARALRPKCLKELGITFIINTAASELPVLPFTDMEVLALKLSDSPTENIVPHLHAVADALEDARRRNGCALVHCIAGVSRSPAFVLAYLVKYLKLTLRQAFQRVRQIRPNIRPNTGFFKQLIDFEIFLRGHSSVRIIHNAENGLSVPDVCDEELKLIADTRWVAMVKERKNFHKLYT